MQSFPAYSTRRIVAGYDGPLAKRDATGRVTALYDQRGDADPLVVPHGVEALNAGPDNRN